MIEYVILIGLASASISFTISITSIFEPLRNFIIKKAHPKLDEFIHCPFCLGTWITIFLTLVTTPLAPHVLVQIFAAQAIVGLSHYVLLRAYEPVVKLKVQRKINQLKNDVNQ